jgi:hypothetical protein
MLWMAALLMAHEAAASEPLRPWTGGDLPAFELYAFSGERVALDAFAAVR